MFRPLRLAVEGALAGGLMVAIVTNGDFSAAWQSAIGIVCGLVGLIYRATRRRAAPTSSVDRSIG